jgi:hypothetical protein
MLLKRLIVLLTCLSLMLAIVLSYPATAAAADDQQSDTHHTGTPGNDEDAVSTPTTATAAVSPATLPNFGGAAHLPVLLLSLGLALAGTAGTWRPLHAIKHHIGPAPLFFASTSRHTYLRIRVLLI